MKLHQLEFLHRFPKSSVNADSIGLLKHIQPKIADAFNLLKSYKTNFVYVIEAQSRVQLQPMTYSVRSAWVVCKTLELELFRRLICQQTAVMVCSFEKVTAACFSQKDILHFEGRNFAPDLIYFSMQNQAMRRRADATYNLS